MDIYEELANAVILQAVKDYRQALRQLKRNPDYKKAEIMKQDCERFFRSEWFEALTKVDGPWLMRKLREEVI